MNTSRLTQARLILVLLMSCSSAVGMVPKAATIDYLTEQGTQGRRAMVQGESLVALYGPVLAANDVPCYDPQCTQNCQPANCVPNTGRLEFSLQPNLSWAVSKNLTLNVNLNVPIYTRIRTNSLDRDVQLTEQVGVFVGMSWHF